jgi:hypothetical protein
MDIEIKKGLDYSSETVLQTWFNGTLKKLDFHTVHISSKASKYVRRGILDNMIWKNGKSFIVELKTKSGRLKPEQEQEIETFKRQNIPVYVCRTPEECIDVLKLFYDCY